MSADIEEQYDKIYRYCYFKTQNAALAEDLTQECFLKYISQNTYVERGKELAYLYTIAEISAWILSAGKPLSLWMKTLARRKSCCTGQS